MVNRIGGLASGMDIDALVEKLMNAERAPLNKLYQNKQRYEWQRDAYRNVNTKLKTFDTYIADNLVLKTLNSKTATSSNSNLVSATATGKATGTLSIEGVSQLATAARGVGTQINANGATKLSTLFDSSNPMPSEIKLSAIDTQGKLTEPVTIALDENMTVDQFVSKINSSSAGVSAIFEGNRLSITAKNTGREVNGNAAMSADTNGSTLFAKLGLNQLVTEEGQNAVFQVNGIATERTSNSFTINGYNVTLKETFNGAKAAAEKYNAAYTEWKNTSSAEYNQKITDAEQTKIQAENDYNIANTAYTSSKEDLFGTVAISDADKAAFNKINNPQLARSLNTNEIQAIHNSEITSDAEYQAWLNDDTVVESIRTKLKDANITFDQFNALKSLDEEKLQSLSAQSMYNTLGATFLNSLTADEKSLLNGVAQPISETDFNTQIDNWKTSSNETEKALGEKLAKLNAAQKSTLRQLSSTDLDAMSDVATKYIDNNAKLAIKNTKESEHKALVDRQNKALTDFKEAYKQQYGTETGYETATAISEEAMPTSTTSPVTMTSTTNVDDMMTKIKEFVNTYNGLVKGLNDQTKESKYRDYAPLTSEQKEEMSEDEIKLWEEKAKSGLLRNDSLIREGLSNMRSLVYESNPAIQDPKFNTLFSIGITTSKSYNDGGTLEINEEKLRKALEENPDAVEQLFKNSTGKKEDVVNGETVDTRGYLEKLRESMKNIEINIEKKAGRSTMTDAQYAIGKSLMNVENRIETWKDKLENIEARYWKQFTAMETAINKANQQSSMFMQG
ncbi:flagellar filament capping protein FliD [Lysinibacillus sp. 3P01SB]|uniref:flagellar filament capping protein FliD n=1 Tax=Lysinibacillus sp. 3P01SB TaxID=3132284 RepID=UPI0039A770DC